MFAVILKNSHLLKLYIKYLWIKGYIIWTMIINSMCMVRVMGTNETRLVICYFLKLGGVRAMGSNSDNNS